MLKILVPIDGSECALRALNTAIQLVGPNSEAHLHLLNVPLPILSGHARMFLEKTDIQSYYNDEGDKALADAKALAEDSGLPHTVVVRAGPTAQTIADYAREQRCDHIVMGTRGLGTVPGMLLGSVAHKLIHLAEVPVTLVK